MVGACVCLHNFLMADRNSSNFETRSTPEEAVEALQNSIFEDFSKLSSNNAKSLYFMSKFGSVAWQFDHINKGCE